MLVDQQFLAALAADPLAAYPALAALLLASVAIASGLMRGDVLALARPVPAAWVAASIALVWGMASVAQTLPAPWSEPLAAAAVAPLALVAVAYGPTPALVALALVFAWTGAPPYPSANVGAAGPVLLSLELALLGWLAIAPSPRRHRIVAGVYLLVAHALTWSTAGLAWIVASHGDLTFAAVGDVHGLRFGAMAGVALLLALLPPALWRGAFPASALAPRSAREPRSTLAPHTVPAPRAALGTSHAGEPSASHDGHAAPAPGTSTLWDGPDARPWSRRRERGRSSIDADRAPMAPAPFERTERRRGRRSGV